MLPRSVRLRAQITFVGIRNVGIPTRGPTLLIGHPA